MTMATSGRSGPISTGSRGATRSGIATRSTRWQPWLSAPSLRRSPASNNAAPLHVRLPGRKAPRSRGRRGLSAAVRPQAAKDEVCSMRFKRFDVVILGGGNAGIGVTGPVRRAGMSVAMIEADILGGTCPNRGCTPKKVLVAAGHALHEIERAAIHHVSVGKPKLDWSALIDREKDLIKDIPANLTRSMARRDVEVIKGRARAMST